jgi:hypothetical protein
MTAKVLKVVGVTLVWLLGLFGTLFIAGETLDDPGGVTGLALVLSWAVPMTALSVFALARPHRAVRVLALALLLVAVFSVVDAVAQVVPRDEWGPVATVAVFTVAVPSGLLGLNRAREAGLLLLGAAGLQALTLAIEAVTQDDGRPFGAALGGSNGVLVLPLLVVAALFLASGATQRPSSPTPRAPTPVG